MSSKSEPVVKKFGAPPSSAERTGFRQPPTYGTVGPTVARTAALSVVALLLFVAVGAVGGLEPRATSAEVLAISQSHTVTAQSTFTVSVEVAHPANVHFAYFTFCQLTSPVCYLPVSMALQGSTWFVGTTKPMTSYPGMNPGVVAGYNITIEFTNNTNLTEPRLPNPFSNLTVVTSVTGEYMFRMAVQDLVFGLQGVVTDATTHYAIAGATVALTAQNNTMPANSTVTDAAGGYAFTGVFNGTYELSVTDSGYRISTATVVVAGKGVVKDFVLSSSSSSGGILSWLRGPALFVVIGAVVVAVGIVTTLAYQRSRGNQRPPDPGSPSDTETPRQTAT